MRLNFLAARKEIDPEKDKGLLKEAMQAARNIKDEDLKLDYERNFVKLAYKEGRYEEAAGGFQKLLGRNPKPSEATYLLANCYSLIREQTKDEGKKKEYARKALDLYLPITEDKELSEKYGKPLLLNTMGYCDLLGEKEKSEQLLQLGLEKYPDDPSLNRRAGALAFQKKEYKAGLALFEKSLKLNPEQPQLAAAVERYRKKPEATDFRPSKPEDCIARPLIHVSVRSGSPFPLREESVKVTLNGKDVGFARGGNEFFYTPEEDLKAGMHIVMVVAEDTMGNRAEQEFKFPVDHTPPLAELVSPTGLAERDQMFVVKCYDELTSVRIDSIRISIRNAKGNPHFLSKSVIIKGEYKVDDKDLGINRGDPIRDPAKIVFRLDKPLASGNYEMQVVMEDVLGHSGKETFNFRAR
jgi:tetratricopeptide (TPR) repeat protein